MHETLKSEPGRARGRTTPKQHKLRGQKRKELAEEIPTWSDADAWQLGFTPQGVRHLWEAGRLGLGETDTDKMTFPGLSLRQAIQAFTEAAYGRRLTFEHA